MSQQYVYFTQQGQDGPVKIGLALDPESRLRELQVGNPNELRLLGYVEGGPRGERRWHTEFAQFRIRGEWFHPADKLLADIRAAIKPAVDSEQRVKANKLVLNQAEAAEALGMGVNTFKKHVRPYVACINIGTRMLFPVDEIQKWVDRQARSL